MLQRGDQVAAATGQPLLQTPMPVSQANFPYQYQQFQPVNTPEQQKQLAHDIALSLYRGKMFQKHFTPTKVGAVLVFFRCVLAVGNSSINI
jgi:hypothetical protein